jgi:hypothetical protein
VVVSSYLTFKAQFILSQQKSYLPAALLAPSLDSQRDPCLPVQHQISPSLSSTVHVVLCPSPVFQAVPLRTRQAPFLLKIPAEVYFEIQRRSANLHGVTSENLQPSGPQFLRVSETHTSHKISSLQCHCNRKFSFCHYRSTCGPPSQWHFTSAACCCSN